LKASSSRWRTPQLFGIVSLATFAFDVAEYIRSGAASAASDICQRLVQDAAVSRARVIVLEVMESSCTGRREGAKQ